MYKKCHLQHIYYRILGIAIKWLNTSWYTHTMNTIDTSHTWHTTQLWFVCAITELALEHIKRRKARSRTIHTVWDGKTVYS